MTHPKYENGEYFEHYNNKGHLSTCCNIIPGFYFVTAHITQNIAERYQEYFQYFIAIETFSQSFCQILQNILSQHYDFN